MTSHSPVSHSAFVPVSFTSAPMRYDGRRPASTRISESMEAVVVLPWVPATATHLRVAAIAARTAERRTTAIPRRRASASSMLSSGTAGEYVTTSAPATCSGSCPIDTPIPSARSRSVTGDAFTSLPLTRWPIPASTVAMALIPTPPTPTTCTWRGGARSRAPGALPADVAGVDMTGAGVTGVSDATGASGAVGSAGMGHRQLADAVRRVRSPETAGGLGHRATARRVVEQCVEDRGERVGVAARVAHHHRGAGLDEGAGVRALVVARSAGEGDQDRRDARDGQLGDRARPRPAHHDVHRLVEARDPVLEVDHPVREPVFERVEPAGRRLSPHLVEVAPPRYVVDRPVGTVPPARGEVERGRVEAPGPER